MREEDIKALDQAVAALDSIARHPSEVTYPPALSPPIPGFEVRHGAFCCRKCQHVMRNLHHMKAHCRNRHGWKSSQRRGGGKNRSSTPANALWDVVDYQLFFEGPWEKILAVAADDDDATSSEGTSVHPGGKAAFLESQLGIEEQLDREERIYSDRITQPSKTETIPWIHHLGWDTALCGCLKSECADAVRIPGREEDEELAPTLDGFERLCRSIHKQCFRGNEHFKLSYQCQKELAHLQDTHVDERGEVQLFEPVLDVKTWPNYLAVAKSFLSFWHRVVAGNVVFDFVPGDYNGLDPKSTWVVTGDHRTAWQDVLAAANGDDQNGLEQSLLEFWNAIISCSVGANELESPAVSFFCLNAVSETKRTWKKANELNPKTSAFIWITQLLIFGKAARETTIESDEDRDAAREDKDFKWSALEAALSEVFEETDEVRQAQAQLRITRLRHKTTVPDLISELDSLADQLNWSALKPAVRLALIHSDTSTYEALKENAKRVEALQDLAKGVADGPTNRGQRRSSKRKGGHQKCNRCHRTGHQAKDCYVKSTQEGKPINRISVAGDDAQAKQGPVMVWAMIVKTIEESDLVVMERDLTSPSQGYTSRSYVAALQAGLLPYYNGQAFQQDNAQIHTSRQAIAFLRDQGVGVIDDWPPYSPDPNTIEQIWCI
ncbi:hypothetical protein K470DRAFT_262261 [Piedraia hortae CBS 480.64]|uniref:CCHC-type domain-containing protein n=1 Tax=Piedraia hortae CBS 480.64 TaxID=1314780 RepID=A0A6A7C922_9PEZI|nr:hypothetical protein K470DRAFT_262261 [Piedraia hortae CBS 480.64]